MVKTCQNAQIMRASGGSKNSLANVPWWVWLLLLLVGWDELMSCRVFIIYVVLGLAVALLVAYQTGHQRAVNQFASKAMGFAYDAFLLPNLPLINSLLMGSVGGGGGQGATTASPADDHSRNIPTEASNKKTE